MSRPDWGALQQEYIAEYTRSGISPVAWCEASRCTGQRSSEVCFRSEDIRNECESVGNPCRILKNGSRIVRQFGSVIGIICVCFKR